MLDFVTNLALRSRALAALVGLTRTIQRWAILLLHCILSSDGKSEAHCIRIKWGQVYRVTILTVILVQSSIVGIAKPVVQRRGGEKAERRWTSPMFFRAFSRPLPL